MDGVARRITRKIHRTPLPEFMFTAGQFRVRWNATDHVLKMVGLERIGEERSAT